MHKKGRGVRMLKVLALGLMVLNMGSWLYAIPTISFNKGGGHTTDISFANTACFSVNDDTGLQCAFNPTDVAGLNAQGLGAFGVTNDTKQVITDLTFWLPTDNFDQLFSASTNLFVSVSISRSEEFCDGECDAFTIVDFNGIGNTQINNGTAGPINLCPHCEGGALGLDKASLLDGEGFLVATFADDTPPAFPGLQPGASGVFGVSLPEPGSFALLLSAAGLLVGARRKFHRG
jgi:hypothetical protein